MFKRILTPLDGSEASESILKWVVTLSAQMGAELVLTMQSDPSPSPR